MSMLALCHISTTHHVNNNNNNDCPSPHGGMWIPGEEGDGEEGDSEEGDGDASFPPTLPPPILTPQDTHRGVCLWLPPRMQVVAGPMGVHWGYSSVGVICHVSTTRIATTTTLAPPFVQGYGDGNDDVFHGEGTTSSILRLPCQRFFSLLR